MWSQLPPGWAFRFRRAHPPERRMRTSILILIVASAVALGLSLTAEANRTATELIEDRTNLAFVFTSGAGDFGCGGLSAFDTTTGEVIYRGPHHLGHSQVATNSSLTQIVASWSQGGKGTAYWLDASSSDVSEWFVRTLKSPFGTDKVATKAGVAIMPDDDRLIFGEKVGTNTGIGRYQLSEDPGADEEFFGPRHGFWRTDPDSPSWIISAPRGRNDFVETDEHDAFVVTEDAEVYILDTEIMAPRSASIDIQPIVIDKEGGSRWVLRGLSIHAALAQNRRHLVTNRWEKPELNSVDLTDHKAYTIPLAADLGTIGGLAFNWGWNNPGLLAVHAGDKIAVYDYQPPDYAEELGRVSIPPPTDSYNEKEWPGYIAWSTDGTRLVAGTKHEGNEFVVLSVESCGRSISTSLFVSTCESEQAIGYGIVTLNGRAPAPSDLNQPCPTPYWDAALDPFFALPTVRLFLPAVRREE